MQRHVLGKNYTCRYISRTCPEAPHGQICTKFGVEGHLMNAINCLVFVDRLKGHGSTRGGILPFSIELNCRR